MMVLFEKSDPSNLSLGLCKNCKYLLRVVKADFKNRDGDRLGGEVNIRCIFDEFVVDGDRPVIECSFYGTNREPEKENLKSSPNMIPENKGTERR